MAQTQPFWGSPFEQLMGTNCPLLDQERSHLLEFLHGPTEEMTEIDEKIAALTTRRKELEQGVKKHRALVHPIRDTPNEVLQAIFLHSLPTKHFPTMSNSEAPLSIAGVCRRWRNVSLQMPELWSSLHVVAIPDEGSTEEEVKFHIERIRRWFHAAGNLPLSISVASDIHYTLLRPIDKAFVNALLTHAPRFHTLELRTSDELLDMFAFHRCTWPALERVVIDVDDTISGEVRAHRIASDDVSLWKASKLKDLNWRSVDDLFYYVRSPSQWGSMERITMSSPHPLFTTNLGFASCVIRTMLRATQGLIELQIPISGHDDDDTYQDLLETFAIFHPVPLHGPPSEPKPIAAELILNHLTTLNLVDAWASPTMGGTVTPFLHNLYLPALTSLVYALRPSTAWGQPRRPPPRTHHDHPLFLFMRAQPQPTNITRWTVTSASICPSALLGCLKLMPALERLWVSHPAIIEYDPEAQGDLFDLVVEDNLLQSFILPQDGGELDPKRLQSQVLCPRLHSIRFDKAELSPMAIHAFLEVRIAYALLFQAHHPPSPNPSGVALLRRFHIRNNTHKPRFDLMGSLYNPVVDGMCLRCSEDSSACSLTEDCKRLGVDVRYIVSKDSFALSSSETEDVFNIIRAGSRSSFNPTYGLVTTSDDDWI